MVGSCYFEVVGCYFDVCGGRTEDRIDARRGLNLAVKTKKMYKNVKKSSKNLADTKIGRTFAPQK